MKKSRKIDNKNKVFELVEQTRRISDTVPKRALQRIVLKERDYSQRIHQHPVRYPDKNELSELMLTDIRDLVFGSHNLPFLPGAILPYPALRAKAKGLSERILPDPQIVKSEILKSFNASTRPFLPVDAHGIADSDRRIIRLGALNLQFNNLEKWQYFEEADREVLRRFHLLAIEETDLAGLKAMASSIGYGYACGQTNSRGQAVGFAIHPRLRQVRMFEYKELTNVQGVPDLRSAVRLDLEDLMVPVNGKPFAFTAVVVHLKSMLGGAYFTGSIRRQQLRKLIDAIGITGECVIILGDFNCILNRTFDTEPLIENGYKLLNPEDNISTHELGGRLDGLFYKNLSPFVKLGSYRVWQFFKNPLIGSSWTDHALLSWKMQVGK